MFLLHSEYLFPPSNFTLVAHPSATSEGSLYRSDSGFSRTDVPRSQYSSNLRDTGPPRNKVSSLNHLTARNATLILESPCS
jgi:hypothetical protein